MESILDWLCDAPIAYNARPHTPDSPALENVKARTALMDQLRSGRTNQQLVTDMAGIFQVSKQAMRIRLENHNLL